MSRQSVALLQPQVAVDEIYRVSEKQLRANRQGNLYLLLQLIDRTGVISGMRWNASQAIYDSFQKGDYLRVEAMAQLHNGNMQLIISNFELIDASQVDVEEFDQLDRQHVAELWNELISIVSTIQNEQARWIAEGFCNDSKIRELFQLAPAGVKTHHAHSGGLLQHVVDLLRLVDRVAPSYPQVDRDILMVGAMLHDIGKLEELSFEGELTYSDPGQLIGHLVQGVQMLDRTAAEVALLTGQPIDKNLLWRLQHMIVSHHGSLEHGSPRVPMTLEAIVLHYIDDLDAKMNSATELIRADRNTDSNWTAFNTTLGRKLYKPSCQE